MDDERSGVRGPGTWCALLLAGAAAGVLAGCAGAGRPVAGPGDSSGAPLPAELPHLGERAALLYLVDRQLYEPVIVREGLAGPPDLRRETALALGRIGDPAGLETLYSLLADEVPEVRREAAFALGEVAEAPATAKSARTRAAARLLEAVDDPDRDTGRLAVEALGKTGVAVEQVAAGLAALPDEEIRARLLPSLFRYPEAAAVPLAAEGLASEDPELHRWAAYALTRRPRPEALPWIRELTADPDPRVRAWAARALGLVGGEAGSGPRDLALLRPLLDDRDAESGPTIQALRAARALVADGRSAPDPGWRGPLLRLFADPRAGVRVTALDAASAWLLDEELGDALAAVAAGERPASEGAGPPLEPPGHWERGAALVALATGGDSRAEALAATAATAADPWLRARAAEAAGILGARHLLEDLPDDPEPRVRQAAGAARLALAVASPNAGSGGEPPAAPVVRKALGDPDAGVRTAALGWLADTPVLPLEELEAALERARRSPVVEERLGVVDALAARAEAEPGERGAIVALLETVAAEGDHPTRLRAASALEDLGRPRPPVGPVEVQRPLGLYRTILLQTAEPKTLAVATERGDLQIRLACPDTPLTCLSLLQLVRQGFYDGLTFHRVVPDFVVQGGDPRGDGWGGPGYTVRDELHRLRFRRGVVGLALTGPDTGGSQLFVTLSAQPHLDGAYTAAGEVVAGREVLERIQPGDRILEIREVEPPRRRRP